MEQRVSLITLGVADLAASRVFYEALGWHASSKSNQDVAFFQLNGLILALWGRRALAEDAGLMNQPAPGFSGMALAYNVRDRDEVERILTQAEGAGGKTVKQAKATFWGGYSGYFADPDGHLWEVAFNPFWSIDDQGNVRLGDE